ncbi:MAG TPA: acyl-CoA dehydrogenase family protein [Myxococcales bacterium]|nr:acyl-CoA dehydrogenase family protein [Myxococcales bacterium]
MSAWFEQPLERASAAPATLAERVAQVAGAELLPLVRSIDEGHYPERVLRRLGEVGAFAPHVTPPEGPTGVFQAIEAMASVGRHCLATAFCVWCQDTFAWYLANSENRELRERFLPGARSGALLGGTGLSNPMKATCGIEPMRLLGREVAGGFVVNGTLPWVSNLGPLHHFGTSFQVAGEDRQVMALVDCSLPGIRLGGEARFLALDGTRTFSVGFREVFIPRALVLADPAAPFIARVKAGFILLQTGMALGLIRGCVDVMRKADETQEHVNRFLEERPPLFLEALEGLESEISELSRTPFESSREYQRRVLRARLSASEWSLRAAQAALLHAGAKGYLAGAAAQRKLREAFFVAIVTPATKHLRRELASPG